ncbi:MAG: DUF1015 domain-containing protein [Firmicutes bacterium]|nr:DUF1015 domain-containing protein [[Eubacterium] siraeum]MCM1487759.1 DUF1015 domain-containing protein [Bacillota bacterium]
MAEIRPFKGLRYTEKAGETGSLCCPPYDIVNGGEREALAARNPYNIIRLELPVLGGSDDPTPYREAASTLRSWLNEEILKKDEKEGIYIYEMEFSAYGQSHKVKGFVSLVKLEPFDKGVILPHEETLSKAKTDRFNLMKTTGCNFSQIYSLYMDEDGSAFSLVDKASQGKPDAEFTDGGNVTHRMWIVTDPVFVESLQEKFADKKLYIADGHHRYETALNYKEYAENNLEEIGSSEYVTMMLVNMENSGLVVFPTHRIVRDLPGFNYDEVCEKCREYFDITPYLNREKGEEGLAKAYAEGKKAFVLFVGNNNYTLLTLKNIEAMDSLLPHGCKALKQLDVSVLHTLVLERIFGIDKENMAKQINLTYTRSAQEAIEAVDQQRANCCFLLNPTRVEEIRDVAAAGDKMPQKSTYFYPKLTTGLVMNKIF